MTEPTARPVAASAIDDPLAMRQAGRELLSLALIDARNRLLARLAEEESPAALRLAAHAGWFQERWIARNLQRLRGEAADPGAAPLAGIEPAAERWLEPSAAPPDSEALRAYLCETLETTLALLAQADEDDAGLYFYRVALLHEDRLAEALVERRRAAAPVARAEREAIWLPARRWRLGSERGSGFVPHNERWAHEVAVPEFEIDAQPVSWRRYIEFAEDGGYDRRTWWSEEGWAWLQAGARRAPLGVEQFAGGVLIERGGRLQRAPADQPVTYVTYHEAEAWCRWAGRRLPTEPEWDQAAATAASRGFVWGDVFEWVAGSARAWPDAGAAGPACLDRIPPAGTMGVLRGASFATCARRRSAKARRFAPRTHDTLLCGWRSCAP